MDMKTTSAPVADIRWAISRFREHRTDREKGGEHYRVDRTYAEEYFEGCEKRLQEKVYSFLYSLEEQGEPVVYVDICGRAKLGFADVNYSFSLQPNRWTYHQVPERVVGDLFSAKDFYGFLCMISDQGYRPSFVTCVPIAGLNAYYSYSDMKRNLRYEEVLYQRLENNLRATIELLRPGGFIYLSEVLQGEGTAEFFAGVPHDKRRATIFIRNLCKSMRCSVDLHAWHGGTPSFLIRKWLR